MMLNPDPLSVLRLKLRRAGFFPIPAEGKRPPMNGWQDMFNTNSDEIALWSKSWHLARNTGVLAKHTPALDIDLMDEDACEAIETLVGQMFEDGRILVRIGKAPKRLIPFQTTSPFTKRILAITAPNGIKGKVEVLASGQHYVVDGVHPETKTNYCWHGADHLADVPARDLPLIRDAGHAQEVLDRIGQMLVDEHGYTLESKPAQPDAEHPRGDPADWAELTRRILTGVDIHDSMVKLSASHASCRMPIEISARCLRSLLHASALPRNERWEDRLGEIEGIVRSGYAKFAPAEQEATPGLNEWDAGDEPGTIPPRQWLLANQFCIGFISSIVASGGTGKSALRLLQFISLATGRPLCGQHVFRRCRVLLISLEDDSTELQRRITALLAHYKIDRSELRGWLFCASPKLAKIAVMNGKARAVGPLEPWIREAIERRQPDLVSLDPFIKTHSLEENASGDMDFVCDLLARLAVEYNVAIDSPHHVHKGIISPGDADSGRGSSGIRDAGRLIYTLAPMSTDEAKGYGINPDDRCSFIRLDSAKLNIAARSGTPTWFHLVGVPIDNATEEYPHGDTVQVVEPWSPPDTWGGLSTEALNAALSEIERGLTDDDGNLTGRRYSSAASAKERAAWQAVRQFCPTKTEAQCREIIKTWEASGVIFTRNYEDPEQRRERGGLYVDEAKRPGTKAAS